MTGPQARAPARHRLLPCRKGCHKVVYLHLYRNPFFRLPAASVTPFNRWERKLCHPFAAAELNRAILARTAVRADLKPLYLLGLTLSIPTFIFLCGLVNNFIR